MDHEEVDGLYQDATTPIEAVMAQTGVTGENAEPKPEGNGTKGILEQTQLYPSLLWKKCQIWRAWCYVNPRLEKTIVQSMMFLALFLPA